MLASPRNILLQIGNFGAQEMKKMTPKASGKTRRSIKPKVTKAPTGWKLDILVPDHWRWAAVTGRPFGPPPPVDRIEQWLRDIGGDPALAFIIARAIGRDGTKLFQKGGNELQLKLIESNIEKMTVTRLDSYYTSLVEGTIEAEIARL